ncbi:hypothetical protein ACFSQQ_13580 [Mesorhizobium kowhaii]|uniref:hypothetical protein n=1 Tax=Mesorhizobium kowhaii TaxID=1300272 RepID=UPI0035E79020
MPGQHGQDDDRSVSKRRQRGQACDACVQPSELQEHLAAIENGRDTRQQNGQQERRVAKPHNGTKAHDSGGEQD